MLSLFLGTGIRISECVGLNIDDFDFEQNAFVVTRKGGKELFYTFPTGRGRAQGLFGGAQGNRGASGHENAFFCRFSGGGSRSAVEKHGQKYAAIAAPLKKKSVRISSAAPSVPIFTVKLEIFISLPTYWDIRTSTRRANTTRPSLRIIAVLPRRKPSYAKSPSIPNRPNKNRFVFRQIRFKQNPEQREADFAKLFGVHIIFDCLVPNGKRSSPKISSSSSGTSSVSSSYR